MPGLAAGYEELVGSSPRLSDSQIAALSGRRRARSPTAAGSGNGADGDADAGAGGAYRLDMTGSSSARQVTSTPAAMIASAPTKATPRQGKAANTTWDGKPETPVPAAWPWPPPAVLPMSDPVTPEPTGAPVLAAAGPPRRGGPCGGRGDTGADRHGDADAKPGEHHAGHAAQGPPGRQDGGEAGQRR